MSNLISEGLNLMVFGMGFVFVFLTLLVFVTNAMSKLVVKYEPAPQPKATSKRAVPGAATAKANNDELVAVIAAAVHKHRS